MNFTLRQLEACVAVSETQSFTKAAEHLHLTASAVSQIVIELEGVVGYRLFDRSTRRVVLSQAGRSLMPSFETILRDVATAQTVARDVKEQASGVVRIAAPMVVASVLLPDVIARYREKKPKVLIRLIDCAVERLVDMVSTRDVDMAVGPDRPVGADVERVPLFPSPWVVWCSPRHLLARKKALKWSDLIRSDFIAAGRDHETHLALMTRDIPNSQGVEPAHVVSNVSTALGLAAANLCVTLSPAYVSALALPLGLVMRRIVGSDKSREMSLYLPAGQAGSPVTAGFADFVKTNLKPPPL